MVDRLKEKTIRPYLWWVLLVILVLVVFPGCENLVYGYLQSQIINESSDPNRFLSLTSADQVLEKGTSTTIIVSITSDSIKIIDSQLTISAGAGTLTKLSADSWRYTASSDVGGEISISGTVQADFDLELTKTISVDVEKSWVNIGSPYFSPSNSIKPIVAVDNNDVPYVAFGNSSALGGPINVMKYTGSGTTGWEFVGTSNFSSGIASYINLQFDNLGVPYVAFKDHGLSSRAVVMKYNGSGWETLGAAPVSPGEANYVNLFIDHTGTPFLAYEDGDDDYKPKMWKYAGGWLQLVYNSGGGGKDWITICVNPVTSKVAVAYQNWEDDDRVIVKYYNDIGLITSWINYGDTGFSNGASLLNILRYHNGIPYLLLRDDDGTKLFKLESDGWALLVSFSTFMTTPASSIPVFEMTPDGRPFFAQCEIEESTAKVDPKVGFLENGTWNTIPIDIGVEMDFWYSGFSATVDSQSRPIIVYGEQTNKTLSVLRYQ